MNRNMSTKVQRVLVIQDASKKLETNAITWALHGLSLKPGDQIKFLGIVQPFRTVNTSSSFMGCPLPGFKTRLHSSATIKKKRVEIEEEEQKKLQEYQNSAVIQVLQKLDEMQQVQFDIKVEAGALKEVTVKEAKNFDATFVILDRQMKKDQKYFTDNLHCGILRMKNDGSVEHVRTPAETSNHISLEIFSNKATTASNSSLSHNFNMHNKACEGALSEEWQDEIFKRSTCSLCKNRRPEIQCTREFTYSELIFATNGFCQQNLLSQKGKEIYSGRLRDGLKIVVRKHALSTIKEEEFKAQSQVLGQNRHNNVALLLGSCSSGPHKLLVYEYVCNGSLNTHLSNKSRELTWEKRMKIAMGAAKGLQYLHRKRIYGNMRPSNILLTHDLEPRVRFKYSFRHLKEGWICNEFLTSPSYDMDQLANFGLTRNQYEGSDHSSDTRVLKTFEYLAPEYEDTGIDLSKADVYSFGVVLLELITGRKTVKDTNGESYIRWGRPLLQQKVYAEIIDPALLDSHDIHQLFCMVRVVEKCISWDPYNRLSIHKVVKALTSIVQGGNIKDLSPTESELTENRLGLTGS